MQRDPEPDLGSALSRFCAEECADTQFLPYGPDTASFFEDWRGRFRGRAIGVVQPGTTQDVSRIVVFCGTHAISIVPQGGNTGLCGGGVPMNDVRQVVLSMSRMNRIRATDLTNASVTVEAGCVLQAVQVHADGLGRLFPLSFAAEGSAQIGGVLATNAGGTAVLRYGNARALVLGIEAVFADGEVLHGLTGLRKDNTGYDLRDLLIGSEGTLGVITAAVLRLYPKLASRAVIMAALDSPQNAIALLHALKGLLDDRVTAFEVFSSECLAMTVRRHSDLRDPFGRPHRWYALIELADADVHADLIEPVETLFASAIDAGSVLDVVVAASESQMAALWAIRESISESQKLEGYTLKHDVSVPISAIPAFLERIDARVLESFPGIAIAPFGHFGDGNIHLNMRPPDGASPDDTLEDPVATLVYDVVASLGGSISAEHGIGQLKVEALERYKDPAALQVLRHIKSALDPGGIMNPGKVLRSIAA